MDMVLSSLAQKAHGLHEYLKIVPHHELGHELHHSTSMVPYLYMVPPSLGQRGHELHHSTSMVPRSLAQRGHGLHHSTVPLWSPLFSSSPTSLSTGYAAL